MDQLAFDTTDETEARVGEETPPAEPPPTSSIDTSSTSKTDITGKELGDNVISPARVPPLSPELQKAFYDFLTKGMGKGLTPFPSKLSPSTSATRLPEVWNSWQPWDAGTQYLAQMLTGGLGIGKTPPNLQNMMQWGGTGGPGNNAMSMMMQYGTPSQAGQFASNLAQFGGSSSQTARPLNDLAYGRMSGPAAYLAPFLLSGAGASPYRAPMIPSRTVGIRR